MKDVFYTRLFALQEKCAEICTHLIECLKEERKALIENNTDEILTTTMRKEYLVSKLRDKREELMRLVHSKYPDITLGSLEEQLPKDLQKNWQIVFQSWQKQWNQMLNLCEVNQDFMRHSLRNMGILIDHMKRLLGDSSTYSSKGQKLEKKIQGRVVERRY